MAYTILFNPDGSWHSKGKFPQMLKDMTNIALWTRVFFKEFNEVGKKYSNFISNDGRLVGQEKISLIKELDDVISGLILFRAYITNEKKGTILSLKNKFNFVFTFNFDEFGWNASGKVDHKYGFNIKNFMVWYNGMMGKLKEVFTSYSDFMSDDILDQTETEKLCRLLDFIIFEIIVIEKKLITSDLIR